MEKKRGNASFGAESSKKSRFATLHHVVAGSHCWLRHCCKDTPDYNCYPQIMMSIIIGHGANVTSDDTGSRRHRCWYTMKMLPPGFGTYVGLFILTWTDQNGTFLNFASFHRKKKPTIRSVERFDTATIFQRVGQQPKSWRNGAASTDVCWRYQQLMHASA